MIAYLKGRVLEKGREHVILLCGDVGYLVSLPTQLFACLEKGQEAALFIHQIIREDANALVGFATVQELEFFWKLISVSGVGPKMALAVMSLGPVESVRQAVEKGDVAYIESAHGVGRKSAQRIVLELKGKLITDDMPGEGGDEVVSALENLGYPRHKAREIVKELTEGTTEERIKLA
ncbi:MAG TPA: Holliday junction branch migration protein RuvA, partial [Candidatus Baltobacteraceae bacterium]|nr:Holliday junction branch migration protein RuvA [Candidatus Baltobacteraceae bacterium]